MKRALFFLSVIALIGTHFDAEAQKTGDERWRVTFAGGINEFDGDSGDELFDLKSDAPALRFGLKYYLSPYFDLDWAVSYGGLDFVNFNETILDTDLSLQYIPFGTDSRFSPLLTAGVGVFGHDDLDPTLMAPLGAGFRLKLVDGWDLIYTGSYKYAFDNDYSYLQHMAGFAFNLAGGSEIPSKSEKDSDMDGMVDAIEMEAEKKKDAVDTDGDGVPNYLDTDSDNDKILDRIEAGLNASAPVDTDNDGMANYKDTDSDQDGLGDTIEAGINPDQPMDSDSDNNPDYTDIDSDNDGIKDVVEILDPTAPVDTDGDKTADYLDTDSDNDGILDSEEAGDDPDKPLDTNGNNLPDYRDGDSDGDGVGDGEDLCRLVAGSVAAKGCPDRDSDGVEDKDDLCPEVAGLVENKGCPEIKEEVKEILAAALEGINFQSGKAVILKSSYPVLDKVVQAMKDQPVYKLEVSGHTDNTGRPETNLDLSQRRAEAASNYLIENGIEASRIVSVTGYGITQPIADNNTREGRARNRRVEFKVVF